MYLNQLNSRQKELFLDLSLHLSKSDNDFSEDEKKLICQLCTEMEIPVRHDAVCSFDEAADEVAAISSIKTKRIFMLELAGIVMADNVYGEDEKVIMVRLSEKFDLRYSEVEKAISLVSDLYKVYSELSCFIGGDEK